MKRGILVVLVLAGSLAAHARARGQAAPAQNPPAQPSQQPAPAPAKPAESNAFPEDTSNVPLMPSSGTAVLPPGTYGGEDDAATSQHMRLPGDDADPVRSPDDPAADADAAQTSDSSSSLSGLDKLLPAPGDDDQPQGKKKKRVVKEPEHKETSVEDIQVGEYYLEIRNWKAALSRFESALVLAPDEPEVYWGLAESARHLGNFAEARGYYQKVAEYDPDSKHGKEAIKALKEPEIANARAAAPAAPAK